MLQISNTCYMEMLRYYLFRGRHHIRISKGIGRQRIRCQADKINLHIHNPFPDTKQTAYRPHGRS